MVAMSSADPNGNEPAVLLPGPESFHRPKVSGREAAVAKAGLERWLRRNGGDDEGVFITSVQAPTGNGSSYDTFMFDATWPVLDNKSLSLVARIAPAGDAIPLLPVFDFEREARALTAVRKYSSIPAPVVFGHEQSPEYLGASFLVTVRVAGQVPPDYPPYPVGSWLTDGTPEQLAGLQSSTVGLLADLYQIEDAAARLPFLQPEGNRSMSVLRRDLDRWRRHFLWAARGIEIPLMDDAFEWLERHFPEHEGPTVISWGDSRIGNVIYRDFRPVAALDWEVAGLDPPEVDLCYLTVMHDFLVYRGVEGGGTNKLPNFLEIDRVAEEYSRCTGYEPRDLPFYLVYASVRFAAMAIRVSLRKIEYGVRQPFTSPNELIPHAEPLAEMIGFTN